MRHNYERLAWTTLLISFAICVGLAVGTPWAIQSFVRYSYTEQSVTLDVQEGRPLVTCPDTNVPIAAVNRQDDLCQGRENIVIATGQTDQGQLYVRPRSELTATLASVQIYRDTQFRLQLASTPRFPRWSHEPDRVVLQMDSGRIRVRVPSQLARQLLFQVVTPQALVQLEEGNAYIEVLNDETQVVVREGVTFVLALASNSAIQVRPSERVAVPTGSGAPAVMPAARDLLGDQSDFREPIGKVWESRTEKPQIDSESPGEALNVAAEGREVVELTREGTGHAETGIRRDINRDIRDVRSLRLQMVLRVLQQDVPVCGTLGSECPVMVRLDYVDESGDNQSWLQGFYALPDSNVPGNPTFCVTCNPRNDHIRISTGIWHLFDSDNLIPLLSQVGSAPVFLKSIYIYASGHTYRSQIAEVELTVQE